METFYFRLPSVAHERLCFSSLDGGENGLGEGSLKFLPLLKWGPAVLVELLRWALNFKSGNVSNKGAELGYTYSERNPGILMKSRSMIYSDNVFISYLHFLKRGLFKMLLRSQNKRTPVMQQ